MNDVAIKDLNGLYKDKNHQVIFRKEQTDVNGITGEVISTSKGVIAKEKTKAEFIKVFVDNLDYVVKLDNSEKILFFKILKSLNYKNVFMFDTSFRRRIETNKILSRTAMYRAFKGLVDKEIILKISEFNNKEHISFLLDNDLSCLDDSYVVNPDIVGKGNWAELENIKKTIVLNYDFKNYEITKSISQEASYSGLGDVIENPEAYEAKQINQYISPDQNYSQTDIIIGDKAEDDKDAHILELQIELKTANLELEKKNLELKKANLELEIARVKKQPEDNNV